MFGKFNKKKSYYRKEGDIKTPVNQLLINEKNNMFWGKTTGI